MLAVLQPGIAMHPYEPAQNFVHVAHVVGQPQSSSSPNSSGVDVSQIRAAYGFNSLSENGSGQTIAIVDAYDDPTIATDLHSFDVQYNLPDPPSFNKYDEHGGTSYPPTAPSGTNWELEEALDVEWAHAIAPDAVIDLFEADDSGIDNLTTAVSTAAAASGVSVVSMSWGSPEFTDESTYDLPSAGR